MLQGLAYMDFPDKATLEKAVAKNGADFQGRPLSIEVSRPPPPDKAPRGGGGGRGFRGGRGPPRGRTYFCLSLHRLSLSF